MSLLDFLSPSIIPTIPQTSDKSSPVGSRVSPPNSCEAGVREAVRQLPTNLRLAADINAEIARIDSMVEDWERAVCSHPGECIPEICNCK